MTFQNGKSIEGNLTNGFFQEEEFDVTTGTKYTGSGSENLVDGSGSWLFHENSPMDSFEGEVDNGKMKNGTLRSKLVTSIGIRPLNEIVKGVAYGYDEAGDKIWKTSFAYKGEWKNNKPQGKGVIYTDVCVCVLISFPIGDTDYKKLTVNGNKDCGEEYSFGVNVINLFFAVTGQRGQTS